MGDLGSGIVALLLAICTGVQCQDQVDQKPVEVIKEGEDSTISCQFSSNNVYSMHWYRQYPGVGPEFLLTVTSVGLKTHEHFSASFDKKEKESHLSITKVQMKDAVVYFCGAQDRDTGYKVYFGSGTRLVVMPNLANSNPSVYQLKPKEKESNLAACLITDYSPGPIDVKFNSSLAPEAVNDSAVVVKEDGNKESASLGVVIWSKNKNQFQCSAIHRGDTYKAEKEGDATCSETLSDTPVFETDENLNLLSLTVLGLRLIFFKSVALNLILTFWAWSR